MPFFLPTEVAIDKIAAGIDANRFLIAFPLPLYLTSWVFRSLPAAATQLAYRVVNPKTTEWNKIG